jgi:hypothetical protein
LRAESEEIQSARQKLENLGDQLTRDKLLDLVITASTENILRAYVQMMRSGMDYEFFQLLSERIEKLDGEKKLSLVNLRESLLTYTQEVDAVLDERMKVARKNVDSLTQVEDIEAALMQNLVAVDQFFVQALTDALTAARETNDLERSAKLQQAMAVIEELSSNPSKYEAIEGLLALAEDEKSLYKMLREQSQEDISSLVDMMTDLLRQFQKGIDQAGDDARSEEHEMLARIQFIYSAALKVSMEK